MLIENISDYEKLRLDFGMTADDDILLRVYDNKSNICLQTVAVKHPISFIRNLPEVSKSLSLPVSDIDITLIGFLSPYAKFVEIVDHPIISPYVYFKKPDEVNISVGSADSVPPTES